MGKLTAFLRLIRPVNCLIMGFAVLVGMVVATQGFSFGENWVLGFTTGFTFLAAANVINDYYDRKIDAVNKPHRPIPSGLVSPREALVYAYILSGVGFISALLTNIQCLAIATVAWILLMYYNTKGKRTGLPGNFIVSACIALPFIYGGFAAGVGLEAVLALFSAMAFLSTAGREITKGILDIPGDRAHGVKTLAVSRGPRTAAIAAALLYGASVITSFLPLILVEAEVSVWYLPFVALADGGFILSSVSLLRDYSRENAGRVKDLVRLWMVMSLFAFVAGKFGWG